MKNYLMSLKEGEIVCVIVEGQIISGEFLGFDIRGNELKLKNVEINKSKTNGNMIIAAEKISAAGDAQDSEQWWMS